MRNYEDYSVSKGDSLIAMCSRVDYFDDYNVFGAKIIVYNINTKSVLIDTVLEINNYFPLSRQGSILWSERTNKVYINKAYDLVGFNTI